MTKYAITAKIDGEFTDVICKGDAEFRDVLSVLDPYSVYDIVRWTTENPFRVHLDLFDLFEC